MAIDNKQRYMMRGVSAAKEDVHNAIKNIDKGIFPQAFCKIIPDILGGDPEVLVGERSEPRAVAVVVDALEHVAHLRRELRGSWWCRKR